MRRCCNFINDLLIGVISTDPPEPPVVLRLYRAVVPIGGGFGETIVAPGFGTSFIPHDGGSALATFLQTNYDDDSGAGIDFGDASYSFWILAEAAPTDWTWEGSPIEFGDSGLATLKCFETGDVGLAPDTTNYVMNIIQTQIGAQTPQGLLNYGDPGFLLAFVTYVAQLFGASAGVASNIQPETINLQINNTYIDVVQMTNFDGVTTQNDPFNTCP